MPTRSGSDNLAVPRYAFDEVEWEERRVGKRGTALKIPRLIFWTHSLPGMSRPA